LGEIFERRDDAEATRRGTAIHACFELVRWLDFGQPDVPTLKQHLQRVAPWSDNHWETIDQFSEMLAQPAIENLLTRQTYLQTILPEFIAPPEVVVDAYRLEVQTERAFAVAVDNQIMHGKIDRIVLVYEADRLVAADIIDFKTDSADSQNDPQLQTKYRQQIDNYRRAASRFTQLPMNKIAGRLVFLESGTLIGVGGHQPSPTPSVVPPPKRGSHQMKLWRDG
jgi:ATP-dependent exoDNAse (exonuclease V) beta subunit